MEKFTKNKKSPGRRNKFIICYGPGVFTTAAANEDFIKKTLKIKEQNLVVVNLDAILESNKGFAREIIPVRKSGSVEESKSVYVKYKVEAEGIATQLLEFAAEKKLDVIYYNSGTNIQWMIDHDLPIIEKTGGTEDSKESESKESKDVSESKDSKDTSESKEKESESKNSKDTSESKEKESRDTSEEQSDVTVVSPKVENMAGLDIIIFYFCLDDNRLLANHAAFGKKTGILMEDEEIMNGAKNAEDNFLAFIANRSVEIFIVEGTRILFHKKEEKITVNIQKADLGDLPTLRQFIQSNIKSGGRDEFGFEVIRLFLESVIVILLLIILYVTLFGPRPLDCSVSNTPREIS